MTNLLEELHATMGDLIRMHKLNEEMLETLQATMLWIREYAQKNDIPLPHSSTYNSLINKAQTLVDELIQEEPMPLTFRNYPTNFHKENYPIETSQSPGNIGEIIAEIKKASERAA